MSDAARWLTTVEEMAARIASEAPASGWLVAFEHGSLQLGLYAPPGADRQSPHTRDEVYVVLRGSGTFLRGGEHRPFVPGDVIFVPAGMPHRFEDFGEDFATWVMFYGPEGGEAQPPPA